jgi:hypothetical protein
VFQQSSKPAGEDQRLGPKGLHLVNISVHLLVFGIAQGRVPFVGLVFGVMVLRLLGSQEPLALSRRVPLLVMHLVVCRAGTLEAAAHSEVPTDRRVDDRCSCMRCGGYEPSNI